MVYGRAELPHASSLCWAGALLLQVSVFLAVSILLLYFTRPLAEKRLKIGHEKNSIEQMVGEVGLVVEDIIPFETGQVKLGGKMWTAVARHNGDTIKAGNAVKVVKIEGVKLVVEQWKGEQNE